MKTIFSLLLLFYCINFGFYFIGGTLGISSIQGKSLDYVQENSRLNQVVQNTSTSASFGSNNPFGNFSSGIQTLWNWGFGAVNFITGGPIMATLGRMPGIGSNIYFMYPIQAIIGIAQIMALIYLITGRGSDISQ